MTTPVANPPDKPANVLNLILEVQDELGVSRRRARQIVDAVLGGIVRLSNIHPKVKLRDFGNFEYRDRKSKRSVDIEGKEMVRQPHRRLCFSSTPRLNMHQDEQP